MSNTTAAVNALIGADGTLERLIFSFDADHFADVAATASKQWGSPNSTKKSAIQNKFGAVFEQREMVWFGDRGVRAILIYRAGDLDTSTLQILSRAELDRRTGKIPDKL